MADDDDDDDDNTKLMPGIKIAKVSNYYFLSMLVKKDCRVSIITIYNVIRLKQLYLLVFNTIISGINFL
jgi:hypothetical protein